MGALTRQILTLLALGAALMTVSWAVAAPETQSFDAAGLHALQIKNLTGDIAIVGKDVAQVTVQPTKRGFTADCTLTVKRADDAVVVTVEKSPGSTAHCAVDYEITAPRSVNVDVINGSGKMDVQAITGKLTFKWGSGNITARGAFTEVAGTNGSGDVKVTGLTGSGRLQAGSGDVWVDFMTAPLPGTLDIRAGSGDVRVRMPTGTKVATRIQAGSGRVENGLGDDPRAEYRVSVQAGSGRVRLVGN